MIQHFKNPESIRYYSNDRWGPIFGAFVMLVFFSGFTHAVFDSTVPLLLRIGAACGMCFFARATWIFVKAWIYLGDFDFVELHTDKLVVRSWGKDWPINLKRIANVRYHESVDFDVIYLKLGDAENPIMSHIVDTYDEFRDLFNHLQERLRQPERSL
jgi:hypothetical protein